MERPFGRCPAGVPIDQGYIFPNVPFPVWDGSGWTVSQSSGVVTSHECACEDYQRFLDAGKTQAAAKLHIQVAPIRSVPKDYPADKLASIKEGKHLDWFFIHGGTTLPDSFALLDREVAIPATVLAELRPTTVLAPWQWKRLVVHLTVVQWHEEPSVIFHPDKLGTTA